VALIILSALFCLVPLNITAYLYHLTFQNKLVPILHRDNIW